MFSLKDKSYIEIDISSHFFKHAIWSPDGSRILSDRSDKNITVLNSSNLTNKQEDNIELKPSFSISRPVPTCSMVWYPYMNIQDEITNCFLIGSTDNPIHLIDGITGKSFLFNNRS
ncbi:hypothetical protein K502DRAFT_239693 [Neoconidiobolus thromboides FSU 785]|nr:hypothetical protein K502DRAFT_239693 [Neoconidiobolus thromboides FSU 785]